MRTEPTTAAIYCRLSLDRTGEGLGVARQEEACRELAAKLGYRVGRVYVDNDISATRGKRRPEFEQLLKDAPEVVIVWHTDRLTRTSRDLERVLDLRLVVHAVTAGHIDLSTPAGRAVARTITAWATYEGEQKAERQKLAYKQRAKAGLPGWTTRPMGYEMDGTPREPEAQLVRDAYAALLRGVSLGEIARQWADHGVIRDSLKISPGTAPSSHDVRRVLLAARNAGLRVYQGKPIGPGNWPALVDETTWRAAVGKLSDPKRRTRASGGGSQPTAALSALPIATCATCGDSLGLTTHIDTRGEKVSYYKCKQSHVFYPREWLDGRVLLELPRVLPHHRAAWSGPVSADQQAKADRLIAERAELESRQRDLGAQAVSLSLAVLEAADAKLQTRLAEIADELATIGGASFTAADAVADTEYAAQELAAMPLGQYRQLLSDVFLSIQATSRGKGSRKLRPEHVILTPRNPVPAKSKRARTARPAVKQQDNPTTTN